ncbi:MULTISPECIES: MucR family transcriptional regulator [unclassified Sphingopyxis]|uniref:MucR family transcriptional regulator n=1 Tax=unclassified Sphingopyxis TaxID=2614943 RepID=UPI00072FD65D|nr:MULTISPECIES: MucR family transcriptional regulator [unclassified Sphingopyxis]KTE24098.1 hypothetical protein ATE61_14375 [Sphingopyxis sp. H057]KTE50396.1 hypothetical protein ATE64_16295 [Sphingopyxis sp. H073]KTE62978.1 hypothetical protein ATE66_01195 [Sphingopyxis sp. H107]KTE64866.1 hypothetical protein ATE65_10430 [Sphingopyxis sp. H100]KTE72210.1 hypothetical protein ATE60_10425 [Sphingopyxis sp. H081]
MDRFDARQAALDLVTAFVNNNNSLQAAELAPLLSNVYAAIARFEEDKAENVSQAGGSQSPPEALSSVPEPEPIVEHEDGNPAAKVSIERSLSDPNYIISMITGERLKTLSRHLRRHGLDAQQYRTRYNLPDDYPMVAPAYSEFRRDVAKKMALGRSGRAKPASALAASTHTPVSLPMNDVPAVVDEAPLAASAVTEPAKIKSRRAGRNSATTKSRRTRKPVSAETLRAAGGANGPDVASEAEPMAATPSAALIGAIPVRAKKPGKPIGRQKGRIIAPKLDDTSVAPGKNRRNKLKPVFDA